MRGGFDVPRNTKDVEKVRRVRRRLREREKLTTGSNSLRLAGVLATRARADEVEANEVDVFSPAVFGDLQEIQNTQEAGFSGELRRDVGKADGLNRVDFYRAVFHRIARADANVGASPNADAAGDFAAADASAKALGEDHIRKSTPDPQGCSGNRKVKTCARKLRNRQALRDELRS
jgi:hypothetical protein